LASVADPGQNWRANRPESDASQRSLAHLPLNFVCDEPATAKR
jgi:hypothetical protein